jgi:hypothetical protein
MAINSPNFEETCTEYSEEFCYIYKFEIRDTHAFYVNKLRTDIGA